MRRFIIWLFEKYCYDLWIDIQSDEHKRQIMEENNLKTEEEFQEFIIDTDPNRNFAEDAYKAGREDGFERGYKEGSNDSHY